MNQLFAEKAHLERYGFIYGDGGIHRTKIEEEGAEVVMRLAAEEAAFTAPTGTPEVDLWPPQGLSPFASYAT
jgi:hypothetical protein